MNLFIQVMMSANCSADKGWLKQLGLNTPWCKISTDELDVNNSEEHFFSDDT